MQNQRAELGLPLPAWESSARIRRNAYFPLVLGLHGKALVVGGLQKLPEASAMSNRANVSWLHDRSTIGQGQTSDRGSTSGAT